MKQKTTIIGLIFLLLSSTFVSAQVSTDNLIGYWPFNGNANDESGNNSNGEVTGAILTADRFGNSDNAYYFDGVDDFIDVAGLPTDYTAYSFCAWVRPYVHENYDIGIAIQAGQLSSGNRASFGLDLSLNTFNGRHRRSDQVMIRNGYNQPLDTAWYFVVSTWDGQKLKFYTNGVICDSLDVSNNSAFAEYMTIGAGIIQTGEHVGYFNGIIDEVRVYTKALTIKEIYSIYDYNHCVQTVYDSISVTDTLIIDIELTSINPPDNKNTIKIYPNPASDYVIINTGDFNQMASYTIKIVNTAGQAVFEELINQQEFQINVGAFGGYGTYFVKIYNDLGDLIETRKLILE
jgi:hypothetical protein